MSLTLTSLLDLPEGAGYVTRDGRSAVKVERQGDQIKVTGRCDSLAREIEWYEEWNWRAEQRADSLASELIETKTELIEALEALATAQYEAECETRKPPGRLWALLSGYLAGLATGIFLTFLKTTNKRQKDG